VAPVGVARGGAGASVATTAREIRMRHTIALLALSAIVLAACNTMRGVGQDMTAAGHTVSDTASSVQDKM
jgi:predicted small secreted protein